VQPRSTIRGFASRRTAAAGLWLRQSATEPEDIFGAVRSLRVLVAGGPANPRFARGAALFHEANVEPGALWFRATARAAAESNYYGRLAASAAAFLALETESFQLD
jgi:hypothetical protein